MVTYCNVLVEPDHNRVVPDASRPQAHLDLHPSSDQAQAPDHYHSHHHHQHIKLHHNLTLFKMKWEIFSFDNYYDHLKLVCFVTTTIIYIHHIDCRFNFDFTG